MEKYFLMGEDEKKYFSLPKAWQVINNAVLHSEKIGKSVYEMVGESLENPIGTLPLSELVKPTDKITIIVDDLTRPTPRKDILTCLVDRLDQCGISRNQVDVLLGLGTHRPLTKAEIEVAFGKELSKQIRITNHDCRSEELVPLGRLPHAGEVRIHPLVAKADFRITIGSIIPHPFNGFGGGAKLIFPGVVNYEAIRNHHIALMIAKGTSLGNIKDNPFRDEICEAAKLARLDFVINAVYNSSEGVKGIVAGHFEKSQEFGADMCLKEFAINFDQAADVTIASAFPYSEGPQLMKPIGPATMVTKKGGTVIIYASVIQGGRFPDPLLEAFDAAYSISGGDARRLVLDFLSKGDLIVPNAPMDFNAALDITLLYLSRVKVILVSKDADQEQAARLGFSFANSLDEAIEKVSKDIPDAMVNILPSGGLLIPVVNEGMIFEW